MTVAAFLAALRRRAVALIVCILAGAVGGIAVVAKTPKQYQATSTFFVSIPTTTTLANESAAVQVAADLIVSFQKLVTTRVVETDVAQRLGLAEGDVGGHVSATVEASSFFIDVHAVSNDPGRARLIADTTADVVVSKIPEIQGKQANPVTASIIDRAQLPGAPFEPKPRSTVILGLLLGLVGGIGLVALLEALDRTVRGTAQATDLAKAPLLGAIPKRRGADRDRLVVSADASEPYRGLRTAVQFLNPDRPPCTLVMTSPAPGDGKTTTATNLAVAMAESGQSVVLVDADLRQAKVTRSLGASKHAGLASYIAHQATVDEIVFQSGQLNVIPSGPLPPNPSELLGSQRMVGLLEELSQHFDFVLLDAPPALVVTDAVVLALHCDATFLVVRHGVTSRSAIVETERRFEAVGAKLSGVVLNALPKSDSVGYYGQYVYAGPSGRARWLGRRMT